MGDGQLPGSLDNVFGSCELLAVAVSVVVSSVVVVSSAVVVVVVSSAVVVSVAISSCGIPSCTCSSTPFSDSSTLSALPSFGVEIEVLSELLGFRGLK